MEILPCQFLAMSFLHVVSTNKDPYKPIIQAFPRLSGLFFKCATKSFSGTEFYLYDHWIITSNLNDGVSFSPILLVNIIISSFIFRGILTCFFSFHQATRNEGYFVLWHSKLDKNISDYYWCRIDCTCSKTLMSFISVWC